ncbi:hypothetical protein AGMMS50293_26720 [Spirochaetia bacterium]|nr:hypothetical protein AGMMS50293_26720 [Spirochaetia bacterium]
MKTAKNTGHLCSVYCPSCGKVTDKISFNLLREARRVNVSCPLCGEITRLDYLDGKGAAVFHIDSDALQLARQLLDRNKAKDGDEGSSSDADLTLAEILELHDGTETRINALMEKARKRLAASKQLAASKRPAGEK